MRNKMAIVKNVLNLQSAYQALESRDVGVPGLGLVHGFTGAGKTTAIAWLVNQVNGVFVRANATWTPSSMLGTIMLELGAEPIRGGSALMVNHIVSQLAMGGRPLFVDEADYFVSNPKMLETLRDIHDLSQSPVILIGMAGIEKKLVHRLQFANRVYQSVEFLPADYEDTRIVADTVCEVTVDDDLLERLHTESGGSMRLMIVGLARIESLAKANGWESICLEQWGNRQLFMGRGQKTASR